MGQWLRKTAMVLAQNYSSPVSFWLNMTFAELAEWIKVNNELHKKLHTPAKGRAPF